MSLLSKATRGMLFKPQIYTFFGPNGVGKTTLACAFENAVIVDLENGSGFVDNVERIKADDVKDFQSFMDFLNNEMLGNHDFKTLVIDSVEALESLIHQKVCSDHQVSGIESVGFGKGYVYSRECMESVMQTLGRIRDQKGMNIILVAHSVTKTHNDPNENVSYDRYILRANDKLASIVKDYSDSIFFLTYKVDTVKIKDKEKVKAYGDGGRILYTEWRPGFDAKSRYPLDFEIEFELSKIAEVVEKLKPTKPEDVYKQCLSLVAQIQEQDKKEKATKLVEENKSNIHKLIAYKKRLEEIRGKV
jgi:adenylate kinase family enzyme